MDAIKKSYEIPTRVMFYDYLNDDLGWGIAYGNEIICACCGGIFEIDEVITQGHDRGIPNPIVVREDWKDFTKEIAF